MRRVLRASVRLAIIAALPVASIAVAPPAASAYYCGDPNPLGEPCKELKIEALSPPIGSSFEEGQEEPWVMIAAHGLQFVHVYVAFSPQTGSDGHTLSDLDRAGEFFFFESTTDEGVYTSYEGPPRSLGAGTYYWQMEAGVVSEYQTPIYSFVVTPKPAPPSPPAAPPPASPPPASPPPPYVPVIAPPLSLGAAYSSVKNIIRGRIGGPHNFSDKCRKGSRTKVRCQVSWSSAYHMSSLTFLYSGIFNLETQPHGGIHYSFVGTRARYGCVRHLGVKRCASNVHWHP